MKVLVTGGAGYIGSTICSALADAGHIPIVWDSLVTGERSFTKAHAFFEGDIADAEVLEKILREHPDCDRVIHCAARIIVPESVQQPELYYAENVVKSLQLFEHLRRAEVNRVVFSSSASVYAESESFTVDENHPRAPQSPYANTKAMMEDILKDFARAHNFQSIILRYFNPIGAEPKHRSGPFVSNPSHLLGRLVAAAHKGVDFAITGTNWPTRDGSGLRDYIHVADLAQAHVAAVEKFDEVIRTESQPTSTLNLGTGSGVTVREFVSSFERVLGRKLDVKEAPARDGDNAGCCTIIDKAKTLLGWTPQSSLDEGIRSALEWDEIWSERTKQQR